MTRTRQSPMQVPTYTWVVLILGIQKLCEIHTQVLTQPVSKLVVCTKPTREKSQMMGASTSAGTGHAQLYMTSLPSRIT